MKAIIKLSKDFSIPAIDYAGQGNAILGIRDSGKSYTATKAAECLMDAGIPIIAYDPIGIWKYLKVGVGNHKGYPIVVAGGKDSDCDILLTPQNAVEIVKAAMKENVSLVIDLYSRELINKSTWIKIVQETVDELLYQNKEHGMRHIFLEEAAEFIPQRIMPQHNKVYASVEKLVRMGRNASLGITIINPRAEQVNKEVLENMELSLLHKQVGKNSLMSIKKWLEIRGIDENSETTIIKEISTLQAGECFVISDQPTQKIKILHKKTFHPNPKKPEESAKAGKMKLDVTKFVQKMNKQLKPKEIKLPPGSMIVRGDKIETVGYSKKDEFKFSALKLENDKLTVELKETRKQRDDYKKKYDLAVAHMKTVGELLQKGQHKIIEIPVTEIVQTKENGWQKGITTTRGILPHEKVISSWETTDGNKHQLSMQSNGKTTTGAMRMLKAAAMAFPGAITKFRMAVLSRLSYKSGSFATYISSLKSGGLISETGKDNYLITAEGVERAGHVDPLPTGEALIDLWCSVLGNSNGASRIFRILAECYPYHLSKEEIGQRAEMSSTSGSFATYLSTLNRNGLIAYNMGDKNRIHAADELFK